MAARVELRKGQAVIVRNDDGGEFVGTVHAVTEAAAWITPKDKALRAWYPKGYDIGRAHWGSYVVLAD